jgi:hypothetical protein
MSERFLKLDPTTGLPVSQEALSASAGAGDAGKIPALDSGGKLDSTLLPSGVGAETYTATASENLGAGQFVNVWWDSGTRKARLADANNGRPANGFVLGAVSSSATATVYPLGELNNQLSGLTPGSIYFLSATAGGVTSDVSAFADTEIIQRLGLAISATEIITEDNVPVTLADA